MDDGAKLPGDEATHLSPGRGSTPSGWLSSSGSIDHGRFPPGQVIGERYRIVGVLGRGGMGEVYRADDLRLGQAVALKFLPRGIGRAPERLAQLHNEVRTARQVAHPNLCRVYDVGDVNGEIYISMEYVDGEDLSASLRRIGRLPEDRALEIARQLCAGLAAAHDRGVLHRDLKPANIMLDAAGRIRIMDFGLAAAGEIDELRAGTPAYMAPEQLHGGAFTARSDLFALGLVLYELFTGRRRFDGRTVADIVAQHASGDITRPTEIVKHLDPAIERAILRCLEPDPARRPASALAVALSLPGGDPLAAALAAGETPSPELVAASGTHEGLKPAMAWALLAVTLAATTAYGVLGRERNLMAHAMPDRPPEALAERSRQILKNLGLGAPVADSIYGIEVRVDSLQYTLTHDNSPDRFHHLPPDIIPFWYRQSPKLLLPLIVGFRGLQTEAASNPPLFHSGEALVYLDVKGRLLELRIVPDEKALPVADGAPVDWAPLFREAGFDMSTWTSVASEWTPNVFADTRTAWTAPAPEHPGESLRVEAASYQGRPVSFMVIGPWTRATRMTDVTMPTGVLAFFTVALVIIGVLGVIGVVVARRNLRLGRGDRRGASRLAIFVVVILAAAWLLGEKHVAAPWEIYLAIGAAGWSLCFGGFLWIMYLALEPHVRRSWPTMIVSWNRLLSGRVRDPLVGRDMLIGFAAGTVAALLVTVGLWLPQYFGRPAENMPWTKVGPFLGVRHLLSDIPLNVTAAMFIGMTLTFLLVVARSLTRSQIAAIAVLALVMASGSLLQSISLPLTFGPILAGGLLTAIVAARFGLVAMIAMSLVPAAFGSVPLAMQTSAWYSSIAMAQTGVLLAIVLFAFYTSLGGRPMLGRLPVE